MVTIPINHKLAFMGHSSEATNCSCLYLRRQEDRTELVSNHRPSQLTTSLGAAQNRSLTGSVIPFSGTQWLLSFGEEEEPNYARQQTD